MEPVTVQDLEMEIKPMDSFLKEAKGNLTFFDGINWHKVQSKKHLAQLERGLEIYLDKQMEHIEYVMALTMSKKRGELFEVYQKAVSEISDRIRDHAVQYRIRSTKKVMKALKTFFEDADSFDAEIHAGNISSSRASLLLEANEKLTRQNYENILEELTRELDHYHEMCIRMYVGMTDEIDLQRNRIKQLG